MKPTRSTTPYTNQGRSNQGRTINQGAPSKGGSTLARLAVFAPIALEIASYLRTQQKAKRGKYHKVSTKGKALDFVLEQAQRRYGKAKKGTKGWF